MSDVINTLSSIVEISKIVTSSKDFFTIKDSVIDKMLEVVPPKRACVNTHIWYAKKLWAIYPHFLKLNRQI